LHGAPEGTINSVWQRFVAVLRGLRTWLQGGSSVGQLTQYIILVTAIVGVLYLAVTFLWGNVHFGQPVIFDSFAGDSGR